MQSSYLQGFTGFQLSLSRERRSAERGCAHPTRLNFIAAAIAKPMFAIFPQYSVLLNHTVPSMTPTDRDVLLALYNATGGPNWKDTAYWDTDADLSEWYGVKANDQGRVVELSLCSNNLRGIFKPTLRKLRVALLRCLSSFPRIRRPKLILS